MLYQNLVKLTFWLRRQASDFEPACIAQLSQVKLLWRRHAWFKLRAPPCQKVNFSLGSGIKILFILFSCFTSLYGAHFENLVDLTIKVEDPSYNTSVKSLKFNNQDIKLDDPDMFKPRKELKVTLPPGRYPIIWVVEKGQGKWSDEKPKTIEKILVLESGDSIVKVNIKGESVTLY